MGAKRTRTSHRAPVCPHTTSCSFLPSLHCALTSRGRARSPGWPAGRPGRRRHPRHCPGSAGRAEQEGSGPPAGPGGTVETTKPAAWAIPTPTDPPRLQKLGAPPVCPPERGWSPAGAGGSPVTCGRAGRAAEPCGAGSPPPPLRRGRAPGRAGAGRAALCPPRCPRQCQGGLGLCGHLPRSPLPAAGGRGIFSIA